MVLLIDHVEVLFDTPLCSTSFNLNCCLYIPKAIEFDIKAFN